MQLSQNYPSLLLSFFSVGKTEFSKLLDVRTMFGMSALLLIEIHKYKCPFVVVIITINSITERYTLSVEKIPVVR